METLVVSVVKTTIKYTHQRQSPVPGFGKLLGVFSCDTCNKTGRMVHARPGHANP